jgi:heptosyltransferase-2
VDEVITFHPGESPWEISRRLRQWSYALAIVLPNSPRSALECALARIPERIGYARPWRNWLVTRAVAPRPDKVEMTKRSEAEIRRRISGPHGQEKPPEGSHQIFDYLHLVGAVGANTEPVAPFVNVTSAEVEAALAKFLPPDISHFRLLGLNPGAEYGPAKRWPGQNFAAAAKEAIRGQRDCAWVLFGGPGDRQVCNEIARELGDKAIDLSGRTTLRELLALLKACRLVLTNDTGPMHAAAALGVPVVAIFGSTSSVVTGPGLPGDPLHAVLQSTVPCSPCFRRRCPIDFRCMRGIGVEAVTNAIRSRIGE